MPWRTVQGRTELSGEIVYWAQTLTEWSSEDCPGVDARYYMGLICVRLSGRACERWSTELLGKGKVAKVSSLTAVGPDGALKLQLWDMLDYLADHLDRSLMIQWAREYREEARQEIQRLLASGK